MRFVARSCSWHCQPSWSSQFYNEIDVKNTGKYIQPFSVVFVFFFCLSHHTYFIFIHFDSHLNNSNNTRLNNKIIWNANIPFNSKHRIVSITLNKFRLKDTSAQPAPIKLLIIEAYIYIVFFVLWYHWYYYRMPILIYSEHSSSIILALLMSLIQNFCHSWQMHIRVCQSFAASLKEPVEKYLFDSLTPTANSTSLSLLGPRVSQAVYDLQEYCLTVRTLSNPR